MNIGGTCGLSLLILAASASAFALNAPVTFPAAARAKIQAIVDETGNVLFGSTNPGKVEVTNALGPHTPSELATLLASENFSARCADNGFYGTSSRAFAVSSRQGPAASTVSSRFRPAKSSS